MPVFSGGKTMGFNKETFLQAFVQSGVSKITAEREMSRIISNKDKWFETIDCSFLPEDLKSSYKNLIERRLSSL